MLVLPLSLRDILQPAHKLGACLHPLLVPHANHQEKLFRLKDLMGMTCIYYMLANYLKHAEVSKQKCAMCQQARRFFRAHTHTKKAVKNGFFSLVKFELISLDHSTC